MAGSLITSDDSGRSRLERFKSAQDSPDAGFDSALEEIRAGAKRGHWIWYVFPQLDGLGTSDVSRAYGVDGPSEAADFLRDPVLRVRLLTIATAVADQLKARKAPSLRALMGSDTDARKVVSSLTLFRQVALTLLAQERLDGCAALARAADDVLAIAASEGYPACAFTLRQLEEHTWPPRR